MFPARLINSNMNSPVISIFDATLVIFYLVVINVYGANPINETDRPCCTELKVTSTIEDDTKIHGIGHYEVVNSSASNWVYKMKNGTVHIALNKNHGWTGYPNDPDDSDNPALSFLDCTEKCPEECVSKEKWKYYDYETFNFIVDPTLKLNCDGGSPPNLVALVFIIALVTIAIAIGIWKQSSILKWGRSNKYIKCFEEEHQVNKHADPEDRQMEYIPPDPSVKINVDVLRPEFITLPTKTINLTASFAELSYPNADHEYKWKVEDKNDKIKTTGNNKTVLTVHNLSEGSYTYFFYIWVKDKTNGNVLAEGESKGEFRVYPEPSLTTSPHVDVKRIKHAIEGTNLWNDSEKNRITILGSDDLKASLFLQLPKKGIKLETAFTITACPLSDIYIGCKTEVDFDFGSEWKKTEDSVTYKSSGFNEGTKLDIWHKKFDSTQSTISLKTNVEHVKSAIFVIEGKDESQKQDPDMIQLESQNTLTSTKS